MAFERDFVEQLPRWHPWTVERILIIVGSIAGILALLITFFKLEYLWGDQQLKIFVFELFALCLGLILYLYFTSRRKLHRYAQAVFYIHYINHIIRDQIAGMEAGKAIDLMDLLQNIVNATADCFSLLTGKRCRCSIHQVKPDKDVEIIIRDSVTGTQYPNTDSEPHRIEDNTAFDNIWYGKEGSPRFFVSNDLIKMWRENRYKNSSLAVYGTPEKIEILGYTFVTKWPLPYKATIVCPIRYIPKDCMWPLLTAGKLAATPEAARPFVWGYLSIDCKSRNTFDITHCPELLAAIADALFNVFHAERHHSLKIHHKERNRD
jgi:hypothetical protein